MDISIRPCLHNSESGVAISARIAEIQTKKKVSVFKRFLRLYFYYISSQTNICKVMLASVESLSIIVL